MPAPRIGIWLVGAKGGVASLTALGLAALCRPGTGAAGGGPGNGGLVSALPQFASIGLADWDQFVVGGHEIRETSLADELAGLQQGSRILDGSLLETCRAEIDQIEKRICDGTLVGVGPTIGKIAAPRLANRQESCREAIERVQADLRTFVRDEQLERLIVVNVASTEPPCGVEGLPPTWPELEQQLDRSAGKNAPPLPASALYAIAALDLGHPYVNFTPSLGSTPAAIGDLALRRETCHMGQDGKTGETLLKSVLAPMFARRNLEVMSWVGHNIFGNLDGRVLDDPANKEAKVVSKDRLLGQIFGYQPQTHVSIEFIESLGDWKTAWDHVHFRGFLGTPMTFQFIWQGCDSLLAAPLVLDLVRFTERAQRAGASGPLPWLASFFKSPLGTDEHDFGRQFLALEAWAADLA